MAFFICFFVFFSCVDVKKKKKLNKMACADWILAHTQTLMITRNKNQINQLKMASSVFIILKELDNECKSIESGWTWKKELTSSRIETVNK